MIKKHHKNPIHILFSKNNLEKHIFIIFLQYLTITTLPQNTTKYIIGGNNLKYKHVPLYYYHAFLKLKISILLFLTKKAFTPFFS